MFGKKSAACLPVAVSGQPLDTFSSGQTVVLTSFQGGRRLQARLAALGLFPGQLITVCQNHDGALLVSRNGQRLVLGRGLSQKIFALPAGTGCAKQPSCPCWPTESDTATQD